MHLDGRNDRIAAQVRHCCEVRDCRPQEITRDEMLEIAMRAEVSAGEVVEYLDYLYYR